ncbi:nucleoside-diphosphate kinase [candidate division KSB1 bacterium]|nr:nucleoside-diphosphate kinase [candidate division KSB1 bacterium]RQW05230.1 MAG: nucleoside-diphosphate kinase [candidate division KSB1 bacterium]
MKERTLAIIKPDAVADKNTGRIITIIEESGLSILAIKKLRLTAEQARQFYAVHKERAFFAELVTYMTSGPIYVLALESDNAIKRWRALMGATNPAEAAEGSIRKLYGKSLSYNASHGSDAPETAKVEVAFFFKESDFIR